MKATSVVVNGERREIFKDPITDDGVKKSAKGLVKVIKENNEYKLLDQVTEQEEKEGALKIIYEDGRFRESATLQQIRERINNIL